MEQKMSIKEQTLQFIAKVKADPEAFIQYIGTKPQHHKADVERMEKELEAKRIKALNEWLSN